MKILRTAAASYEVGSGCDAIFLLEGRRLEGFAIVEPWRDLLPLVCAELVD